MRTRVSLLELQALIHGGSGAIGDAINNTYAQGNSIGRSMGSGNDRAAALHAMAAAGDAAMVAARSAEGALMQNPSIGVQMSVGSSRSRSDSSEIQVMTCGANVFAGGTAAFVASGDGIPGRGNVNIAGSNVSANDVLLDAKNQVTRVRLHAQRGLRGDACCSRTGSAGDVPSNAILNSGNGENPSTPLTDGGVLQAHENAGGHLIDRHIGLSDAELANRLTTSNVSSASTFANRATAEAAVSSAIDSTTSAIQAYVAGNSKGFWRSITRRRLRSGRVWIGGD